MKYPTFPTLIDEVKKVSITKLKEWNYLDGYTRGIITWSRNGETTARISIFVDTITENPFVEFDYSVNKEPVNYRVPLVRVPSNLGKGFVWYFLCPYTNKRCRKLYFTGKYFLHREAFSGAMYECQTHSKKWREFKKVWDMLDNSFTKAISQKYFTPSYNGKPTRRFKQLLKKAERDERFLEHIDLPRWITKI